MILFNFLSLTRHTLIKNRRFIKNTNLFLDRARSLSQESGIDSPPLSRPLFSKQNSAGSFTRESRKNRSSFYENDDSDLFQHGVLISSESQKSSRIPVSSSLSRRSKTPEPGRPRSMLSNRSHADEVESQFSNSGFLSARTERPRSLSRRSSKRSNHSMSSESLADSVYDDMKWQLGESDMDLSMVYFVYSMLFSLLNRTFYFLIYLIGKS